MKTILEKIYRSSLKFLDQLTPEETLINIVHEAKKLVQGDDGLILMVTEVNHLKPIYATAEVYLKLIIRKKGYAYSAYKKQKSFVIHSKDFNKFYPQVAGRGINSAIFIPLSYKGKSQGVLVVLSKRVEHFSINELHILKLFGTMASLALIQAQQYAKVHDALEMRNVFISIAAHELRTPLTAISGYTQLLNNKFTSEEVPETKWIRELSKQSKKMTILIEELLDVNRMKTGRYQYEFQQNNLVSIMEAAIQRVYFSYPNARILFKNASVSGEAVVISDYHRLIQAIYNILENAIKFSETQPINLKLNKDKSNFIINIIDHGIGIYTEDLGNIFRGFYKAKNHVKEGLGIGLYFARNIINRHQGKISIQSKIGHGTIVTIKLPRIRS